MNILEQLERTSPYRTLRAELNDKLCEWIGTFLSKEGRQLKLAELACGSAYGASLLAKLPNVALSIGLDRSQDLHATARKNRGILIQGDLFEAPFADESFDFVWNSSSLEHFPDPTVALQAMSRLLRPEGLLFVGTPYLYGPLALYYLTPFASWREWLGRPFRIAELEALLSENGFEVLGTHVYFFRFFCGLIARKNAAGQGDSG